MKLFILVALVAAGTIGAVVQGQPVTARAAGATSVILVLTDDEDTELGGASSAPLPQASRLFGAQGRSFTNYWVASPMCVPSRVSMLSGMFPYPANGNRGWQAGVSGNETVGSYAAQAGIKTGYFGKYMNMALDECRDLARGDWTKMCDFCVLKPGTSPPGWDRWFAMCNEIVYFNNTIVNATGGSGNVLVTGDDPASYLTSVIGNASLSWIGEQLNADTRFLAIVAPHAPHVAAIPAPWYATAFAEVKAPRTPSYNLSVPGNHWMIGQNPPLGSDQEAAIDEHHRDRWRTLLSVDDLVVAVHALLQSHGKEDQVTLLYTSDHGYHLGQMRIPTCKLQPYDTDLKVPFFAMGPGISAGSSSQVMTGHIDLAPTVLDLLGVTVPSHMQGRSLRPLLRGGSAPADWRQEYLFGYTGTTLYVPYPRQNDSSYWITADNSSYIGLRIVNATHDLVYTEFFFNSSGLLKASLLPEVPMEVEVFDRLRDPWQVSNLWRQWKADTPDTLAQLHRRLRAQYASPH